MRIDRNTFTKLFLLAASLSTAAQAQSYPTHPVHIVDNVAPGSADDLIARIIADAVHEKFGYTVVVDAKPGANGLIGAEDVAKASADGYTLLLTASSPLTLTPHVVKDVPWDPVKSFVPIVEVGTTPLAIAVSKDSPINSLEQLFAAARAKPGQIRVGILSLGLSEVAVNLIESSENIEFQSIPYKGGNEMVTGVFGNEIDVAFIGLGGLAGQISAGSLKGIGVTTPQRISTLPNIPAVSELIKDYDMGSWFGLFGPANLDPTVAASWSKMVNDVLQDPKTQSLLLATGTIPTGGDSSSLQNKVAIDYQRFGTILEKLGAKPQ